MNIQLDYLKAVLFESTKLEFIGNMKLVEYLKNSQEGISLSVNNLVEYMLKMVVV